MDTSTVVVIVGIVVAAFIVLLLAGAFVADRRRNENVAHDPARLDTETDPTDAGDAAGPADPNRERLHVDRQNRAPGDA